MIERTDTERDTESFLALYDAFFERLLAAIIAACEGEDTEGWPAKVWAGIDAALDFLANESDAARVLTVDVLGVGPAVLARRHRSGRQLSSMLQQGREHYPAATALPVATEQVLIAGMFDAIGERVRAGEAERLTELTPDLTEMALMPYLSGGAKEARRAVKVEQGRRARERLLRESARTYTRLHAGPHHIPAAEVAENQRQRLLASIAEALIEPGYARTSVLTVVKRAGVSKETFYELFDNKQACLLAAYDAAEEQLSSRAARAAASESDWPARLHAATHATLGFLSEQPAVINLFGLEGRVADPVLAERYRATAAALAAQLRLGRDGHSGAASLPDCTESALIAATAALIRSCVLSGDAQQRLPQLQSQLVEFFLTPYLGPVEAQRVASGAA